MLYPFSCILMGCPRSSGNNSQESQVQFLGVGATGTSKIHPALQEKIFVKSASWEKIV